MKAPLFPPVSHVVQEFWTSYRRALSISWSNTQGELIELSMLRILRAIFSSFTDQIDPTLKKIASMIFEFFAIQDNSEQQTREMDPKIYKVKQEVMGIALGLKFNSGEERLDHLNSLIRTNRTKAEDIVLHYLFSNIRKDKEEFLSPSSSFFQPELALSLLSSLLGGCRMETNKIVSVACNPDRNLHQTSNSFSSLVITVGIIQKNFHAWICAENGNNEEDALKKEFVVEYLDLVRSNISESILVLKNIYLELCL